MFGILSIVSQVQAQSLDFPTLETFNPLQVVCSQSGTQATLSWHALDTADLNEVRIDDIADPFDERCQLSDAEDRCIDESGTSVIIDVTPGKTYNWWIYQISKGIRGERVDGEQFSCGNANPTQAITPTSVVTLPICPRKSEGDANCNDTIELLDFAIWRQEYLNPEEQKSDLSQANFNEDSVIDILDFAIWRQGYLSEQSR